MSNPASSTDLFANLKTDPNVFAPDAVEDDAPAPQVTEIDMLKSRAKLMGVPFSGNIGVEALKAKIKAKIDGEKADEGVEVVAAAEPVAAPQTYQTKRQKMIAEKMKLVRLRITNLNPAKKNLPGEIFTVANRVLGTVKKFIPYGEATDNGYHVPYIIYQQLKDREFVNIKTRKDSRGRTHVETNMAREFALEVLPQLTPVELARLAAQQAAAQGMD
jgi:hypothetical protein